MIISIGMLSCKKKVTDGMLLYYGLEIMYNFMLPKYIQN